VVWLIGVALIPLLLAAIGYGVTDRSLRSEPAEPSGPLPTLSEHPIPEIAPAPPPELALAPLAIIRGENGITLDGQFPTPQAKRALLDMVIEAMGDNVNIFDNIEVTPDTRTLDFSSAQPFFTAAANITDFGLDVNGDTVTLSGTAELREDHDAVQAAATKAWSNVNIVDRIDVVR
jgi:peptidoglycan-binding protein ArfA